MAKKYNCPECTDEIHSCEFCKKVIDIKKTKNPNDLYNLLYMYYTIRYSSLTPADWGYYSSVCKKCSNNPLNGGTGTCNCILGKED